MARLHHRVVATIAFSLLVPVFFGTLVACAPPSCESECQRGSTRDCNGDGQPDEGDFDCAKYCKSADWYNDLTGCGGLQDEYITCTAGLQDFCALQGCLSGAGVDVCCRAQSAAWQLCVATACDMKGSGCE